MNKGAWAVLACGLAIVAGAAMVARERPRAVLSGADAATMAEAPAVVVGPLEPAMPTAVAAVRAQGKQPLFGAAPLAVPSASLERMLNPDPVLRQRAENRTARAETLDRRLETLIEDVRARLGTATGAEHEALVSDLAVLEKNLAYRRRLEKGAHGQPARPVGN
jgi:hypothetical protein